MAYMDFRIGAAGAASNQPTTTAAADRPEPARFRPLEWQVIAIAQRDPLSSLRYPGRLATALGGLFGTRHNPRLADPQLESLRRMAVLSWRHGYVVPPHEVRAFVEAGYTLDQYELLIDSIAEARVGRRTAA